MNYFVDRIFPIHPNNSPIALPNGFRCTSALAAYERSDGMAQGRNCIFTSSGEEEYNIKSFRGGFCRFPVEMHCSALAVIKLAQPVTSAIELYPYGLPLK